MLADWENSSGTGLEKVSFHSNAKERQSQRILKLPHNCTHLTYQQNDAQNSPSQASTIHELWTSRCSNRFVIFFLFLFLLYFTLRYCIGFAIHRHESNTGVHEFPILKPLPPPSPYHLSGSSPCTSPKHPVSCIEHRLVICFLHDTIHVSVPFSQIIPPSPSPTESKSPFYISVSLLLSRIQGYHYHLSKFHIYVLVYCIGVFLSGFLHSV